MENSDEQFHNSTGDATPFPEKEAVIYPPGTEGLAEVPPKFEKPEQTSGIWLRSIVSLGLYLLIGYYIFHSLAMLIMITTIVLFHEMGHFIAMKYFRYKDLSIFFIPLLGAYVSGTKREVSQKESAIILLAGPLPGIILGIILYLLYLDNPFLNIAGISYYSISLSLIILNLLNLFPVYPLDGGQLLNRVFLEEESWISNSFVVLSAGFIAWFAWKNNFPVLFIFPLMILLRMVGDSKMKEVEKKVEESGIDMDKSYEELPDKDYWAIRNILIETMATFKDVNQAPPYKYSHKEERIMTTIQSLLHRHLTHDLSVVGKILVILIWVAAIASPWLLDIQMYFLDKFKL
jgi:Zn-dependent protease